MKRLIVLSAVAALGVLVAASIAIGKTAAPALTFKA